MSDLFDDIVEGIVKEKYKFKSKSEQKDDQKKLQTMKPMEAFYFNALVDLNKLGLKGMELERAERDISSIRMANLFVNPIEGSFDLSHLREYHKRIFGDIYYFAGEIRDVWMAIDSVTVFKTPAELPGALNKFFDNLKKDKNLQGLDKEKFVDKMAHYLTDINKIHPFREGNGRSKRMFFMELSRNAGYELDWSAVPATEWRLADECAFDSDRDKQRDTSYLKILLDKAISSISQAGIGNDQMTPAWQEYINRGNIHKASDQKDFVASNSKKDNILE